MNVGQSWQIDFLTQVTLATTVAAADLTVPAQPTGMLGAGQGHAQESRWYISVTGATVAIFQHSGIGGRVAVVTDANIAPTTAGPIGPFALEYGTVLSVITTSGSGQIALIRAYRQ